MTHDPNSFKKVAVLTGLTVLIGGAEISNAHANTISDPTQTFSYSIGSFWTVEVQIPLIPCRLRDLILPWEHSHKWKSS